MATETPVYLVHAQGEPVVVRVQGRAHFRNAAPFDEAVQHLLSEGKRRFVMDFSACDSLDSTVLGILAGLGLSLFEQDPAGQMVLCGLTTKLRASMENVGLQHLAELSATGCRRESDADADGFFPLTAAATDTLSAAQLVLRAHEDLIRADADNASQFRDVIAFVREDIRRQSPADA